MESSLGGSRLPIVVGMGVKWMGGSRLPIVGRERGEAFPVCRRGWESDETLQARRWH